MNTNASFSFNLSCVTHHHAITAVVFDWSQIVQCFHESQDGVGTYWPVCPGNDAKDYCNGEPPNCDSGRCTCEAGENFCKTKVNPCQTGCVLDTSDNIVKPICPGEDYYCDGDQDCNSGITNRCSCPTGELFCKGENICSQPSQSPTVRQRAIPTICQLLFPSFNYLLIISHKLPLITLIHISQPCVHSLALPNPIANH